MNKPPVTLRTVRTGDERFFRRWWRDPRLVYLTSGDFRQLSDHDLHQLFEKLRRSRIARHWLAVAGRTPIGHVTIRGKNPVEIQIMIGEPRLWGQGYGTAIAAQLQARLKRTGIERARMYVWRQNERSIALGKKFGFRPVGQVQRRAGSRMRMYLVLEWRPKWTKS